MTQAVGIFFIVNGNVVFDAAPLENGELYGDTLGFSGHYDYWDALIHKNPRLIVWLIFKKLTVYTACSIVFTPYALVKLDASHFAS